MPRPDQHSDDHLHPWVFIQSRVWVDRAGVEHEIIAMVDGYVASVISFCRRSARRIRRQVESYSMNELWQGLKNGGYDEEREFGYRRTDPAEDMAWLEATPLMHALRERLNHPSDERLAELIEAARLAYAVETGIDPATV